MCLGVTRGPRKYHTAGASQRTCAPFPKGGNLKVKKTKQMEQTIISKRCRTASVKPQAPDSINARNSDRVKIVGMGWRGRRRRAEWRASWVSRDWGEPRAFSATVKQVSGLSGRVGHPGGWGHITGVLINDWGFWTSSLRQKWTIWVFDREVICLESHFSGSVW